jgi:hypothetical protein
MSRRFAARLIGVSALVLAVLPSALAQEAKYKKFDSSKRLVEYIRITLDKKTVTITAVDAEDTAFTSLALRSLSRRGNQVVTGETVLFDEQGLILEGKTYPYGRIFDSRVEGRDDDISIVLLAQQGAGAGADETKTGNLIEPFTDVQVKSDQFCRGIVLSIAGNIEVLGEVNKDVISIMGRIYVAPGAVVRGDLVSLTGRMEVAKDAAVYGETYQTVKKRTHYAHRFSRGGKAVDAIGDFVYNRVDGAAPYLGLRFSDEDSVLPTVRAVGGYAFESARWRYDFEIEQTLMHRPLVACGGSLYRRLASGDDWLLGNWENNAFTLLVTEDYKDYYEGEGGTAFARVQPVSRLTVEVRYRYEQTKWLEAHRHLWSLFGHDKLFDWNFGRVESSFRTGSAVETDTTTNGSLSWSVDYDTRDREDVFGQSAWHASAELEWSHPDLSSDFDYRRYTLAVRRYQRINRDAMVLVRGIYGGSDGYLPMYKRFFTGGLGTLKGYNHKEFMGTRFWLANLEYRVAIPKTSAAFSVFWDAAQTANETRFSGDVEVKHDIGLAAFFGSNISASIAKRLDRSSDDDPAFYMRLQHVF